MTKCRRQVSSCFVRCGSAFWNASLKREIISAYWAERKLRMKGAGLAYARPSTRRKFLPPRASSREILSGGMSIADRIFSQVSGRPPDSRS